MLYLYYVIQNYSLIYISNIFDFQKITNGNSKTHLYFIFFYAYSVYRSFFYLHLFFKDTLAATWLRLSAFTQFGVHAGSIPISLPHIHVHG